MFKKIHITITILLTILCVVLAYFLIKTTVEQSVQNNRHDSDQGHDGIANQIGETGRLFSGLSYEIPTKLQLNREIFDQVNKNTITASRYYATDDFATTTETIVAQGYTDQTKIVVKGYTLWIKVNELQQWHRESIEDLDKEQSDKVILVADTEAYMKIYENFVTTSIFHSNGKNYSFSISFPRAVGFEEFENEYLTFLNSVVIK